MAIVIKNSIGGADQGPDIKDGSITTDKLADGAVTTDKITDNSINQEKINFSDRVFYKTCPASQGDNIRTPVTPWEEWTPEGWSLTFNSVIGAKYFAIIGSRYIVLNGTTNGEMDFYASSTGSNTSSIDDVITSALPNPGIGHSVCCLTEATSTTTTIKLTLTSSATNSRYRIDSGAIIIFRVG